MTFFIGTATTNLRPGSGKEELYLPQVAVGIRDIVGTGVFGSEYIVGSKQIGNTDVTLGLGWGRLAGKGLVSNPLRNKSMIVLLFVMLRQVWAVNSVLAIFLGS